VKRAINIHRVRRSEKVFKVRGQSQGQDNWASALTASKFDVLRYSCFSY